MIREGLVSIQLGQEGLPVLDLRHQVGQGGQRLGERLFGCRRKGGEWSGGGGGGRGRRVGREEC